MQALVRDFPLGADHPELALVRAMGDLAQGRLDEAAARLAAAETYVQRRRLIATATPGGGDRVAAAVAGQAAR